MRARRPDRRRPPSRAEIERRLSRRIANWAGFWRRCPRKRCRRARACCDLDDCAGLDPGSVDLTEEQRRALRAALDERLARRREAAGREAGDAGYDPDERERDRPPPPAPPRAGGL
jgi:hypothetical protein